MLEYNENTQKAKILAEHYAQIVGDEFLIAFMQGKKSITNTQEAQTIINCFWQMTDLAIADHQNDLAIDGITDIEFWMHKLFNKVGGYLIKQGYSEQWDTALDER